jgi:undecaprenyl phosphate N,N'-diacetylbacillosamine 1-phosphate transferase
MHKFYLQFGKRFLDLVLAILALIVFSPFLLIIIILIRLDSSGPILFIQKRLGYKAKIFDVYKFRTMTDRTRDPGGEIYGRDPEVTRLGYWLRRFKLDELPQLLNIARGDLSIVGPRPALPSQLAEYDDLARKRLEVRPGLTGLAQVNGNIHLSWPERWQYDAQYVEQASLLLDLQIILRTVAVVLFGEDKFRNPPV